MKKLWQYVERFFGVYRWHPKIALRYLSIADKMIKAGLMDSSILEIGSGGLGIAPYIKRKVVGLDISFTPPIHPQLIPVKGSCESIPFTDDSFAAVVSVDMLEHIAPDKRSQAISELVRVAKTLLCIGVPCGRLAEKQDRELKQLYETLKKRQFQFFAEQVEYGLPTTEWMLDTIKMAAKKAGKTVAIETCGNINLRLRMFLMRGWISENIIMNIFFRKILLFFIQLLRCFNRPPAYRQLFFVTIK